MADAKQIAQDLFNRANYCPCGDKPELVALHTIEDAVTIHAQCMNCGRRAPEIEGEMLHCGMIELAIDNWNAALPRPN